MVEQASKAQRVSKAARPPQESKEHLDLTVLKAQKDVTGRKDRLVSKERRGMVEERATRGGKEARA